MCEWHFFQWDAAVAETILVCVTVIIVTRLIVNHKRTRK